jgi:hypothetical protein
MVLLDHQDREALGQGSIPQFVELGFGFPLVEFTTLNGSTTIDSDGFGKSRVSREPKSGMRLNGTL